MTHIRRAALAVLSATALVLAVGCGSGTSGGANGTSDMTVALSLSTLNNPFFVQLKEGAEQAANDLNVRLVVSDAQNDPAKQIDQVQALTTQGVKAVVINAVDSKQAAPAVVAARKVDMKVVAVDRSIEEATVDSEVSSDNTQGGILAAEALAKAVGPGDVVVLGGIAGSSASRDRGEGFTQGIAARSATKVRAKQPADFDRARGMDVTNNLLQVNPGVKGVFAENDEMALGAIKALGDRAGRDVQVVGFDGTPEGLAAIASGKMAASIAQQPRELGRQAVEQAVRAVRGEKVRELVEVPVKVVTRENVHEFKN